MRPNGLQLAVLASTLLVASSAAATDPTPPPGAGAAPHAQSNLNSEVQSARIGAVGMLETELAYDALFNAYDDLRDELTLHSMDLLLGYVPRDSMEFRIGWTMFGVVPGDDFDNIAGTGDPWVEGKFALIEIPDGNNPHTLALSGRIQAGIGQDPVTVPGATFEALALYTVRFEAIEVDANAGVAVNTADNPSYISLPLGGRVVWLFRPWMDFLGEITETLHFTRLRSSETQFAAGLAARPDNAVELTFTGGLGLSESLPAGFVHFGLAFHMADFGEY